MGLNTDRAATERMRSGSARRVVPPTSRAAGWHSPARTPEGFFEKGGRHVLLPPGTERETIERVLQYQTVAVRGFLRLIGETELPDDPKDRGTEEAKILAEIERDRRQLLDRVLTTVRSGKKSAKSSRALAGRSAGTGTKSSKSTSHRDADGEWG
jgi:hypothetical protein